MVRREQRTEYQNLWRKRKKIFFCQDLYWYLITQTKPKIKILTSSNWLKREHTTWDVSMDVGHGYKCGGGH
jgi:hypothetical protein